MDEAEYKKELADAGVDLPAEPNAEEVPQTEPEPEAPKEPLQEAPKEPETPRKRSIYDDYKEEKSDRKAAEARAQEAEKERDELRHKLEAATQSQGSNIEAGDDALAYAEKVGADPDLVKRIIDDARKGIKPETDPELAKRLDRFEAWEKTNSKVIEQQMFEDEFKSTVPSLKKLFPSIEGEALDAVKSELDKLSHTKDWHDKPLDYIAFKNQETLSALVSPKKRGMESKGRQDAETPSNEVDLNADYSSMTAKQREAFEEAYKQATKSDGVLTDPTTGKKTLI